MIAYFDCFSGIAGDMILASFIDAGLPWKYLTAELGKLRISNYKISRKHVVKTGIKGVLFNVDISKDSEYKSYRGIINIIQKSKLKGAVKDKACEIFTTLAGAEAKIHSVDIKDVHFHEVGDIDSIIDVVGASIGLDYFKFDEVYASPLPVTRGFVTCAHGRMPVPAPVTMEILKGVPLERADVKAEIVTPTGASVIKTIATGFGENPIYKVKSIGYGHGHREFPGVLNSLRLMIGEGYPVWVLETNIDDMNPQVYDYIYEKLFDIGAVDVALIPIQMKKNRPGIMLQVQVPHLKRDRVMDFILKETTSLGVRYYPVDRKILQRELKTTIVKHGSIRVKIAKENNKIVKFIPEYEDCKKVAKKRNIPLLQVFQEINSKLYRDR